MKIALIVAISKNYVIGNNGTIPWKIKGEQVRFRELTQGKTIIMGRRSFEEIGSPLPNRKTILISSTFNYHDKHCTTVDSLAKALEITKGDEVFIAGGAKLYEEALPLVDTMYITVIDKVIDGDTFFPRFDESNYIKTWEERHDGDIPYTYLTYERKK